MGVLGFVLRCQITIWSLNYVLFSVQTIYNGCAPYYCPHSFTVSCFMVIMQHVYTINGGFCCLTKVLFRNHNLVAEIIEVYQPCLIYTLKPYICVIFDNFKVISVCL